MTDETNKSEIVIVETNSSGVGVLAMRAAREMGFKVHFLTKDPDDYTLSRLNPIAEADRTSIVDTMNPHALVRLLFDRPVAAILPFDDFVLLPALISAVALGLISSEELVGNINARLKDRARTRTNEVSCVVNFVADAARNLPTSCPIPFPCVVKPQDESGSVDVAICSTDSEYRAAVDRIATPRINASGYPLSGIALVEEYIAGDEFSAEFIWVCSEAKWKLIGFTKKYVSNGKRRVEVGHSFPHSFGDDCDLQIESILIRCLEAISLRRTAAHVEFKVRDGIPAIIEINPRLPGDMVVDLVHLARGIDLARYYVAAHAGVSLQAPMPSRVSQLAYAAVSFLTPNSSGELLELRDCGQHIVVEELFLKRPPLLINGLNSSDDRLGFALALGDSEQQAREKAEKRLAAVCQHYAPTNYVAR